MLSPRIIAIFKTAIIDRLNNYYTEMVSNGGHYLNAHFLCLKYASYTVRYLDISITLLNITLFIVIIDIFKMTDYLQFILLVLFK